MRKPAESIANSMGSAHLLAQAGELDAAAALCRSVLAQAPREFYALFMLGSIEARQGRTANAEALLSHAISVNPQSAEALTSYGDVLSGLARHEEAVAVLTRALKLQPANQNALIFRGIALGKLERQSEALADFTRALEHDPRSLFALHNRSNVLIALGRRKEAEADIARLLSLAPNSVPAVTNRVILLRADKRYEEALAETMRGLRLDPANAQLWTLAAHTLSALARHGEALAAAERGLAIREDVDTLLARGNVLFAAARYAEALQDFDKALQRDPRSIEGLFNRTNTMMELGRLDEALATIDTAVAAHPDHASAHLLRGNVLLHLRRQDEALASYDRAVSVRPDYAEAHYHRGSARLLLGAMGDGWRDFEYRWQAEDCGFERPALPAREWRGEPLAGRSIVVYSEQGLGDTIQFARFLPIIAVAGARVTFLCHPNLLRLFRGFGNEIERVASCDPARPFDYQCALMSLPLHLGVELHNVPAAMPYLAPEPERVSFWRSRIGEHGFKIGIAWQGNPRGKIDRGRSVPLTQFAPLASVPGVRLISLQKRHGLDQLTRLPDTMRVEDVGAFDDGEDAFIDTAAIMANLDLIVTSDTATAHLAGALGRPVWVVLQYVPDWRWMLDRPDSPWYPAMRLFRQSIRGRWEEPFAEMADVLRERVKETP